VIRRAIRAYLVGALAALAVASLLAAFAPRDYSRPVNPDRISPGAVSGGPCDADGGVASAVGTNDSGPYELIAVRCRDGVGPFPVAR
jgi:hypothetical protein